MRKVTYTTIDERRKLIEEAKKNGETVKYEEFFNDSTEITFDVKSETKETKEIEEPERLINEVTRETINTQVVAKIRERYGIDDEFQMQRLGLQNKGNVEYLKYLNYVQQCIDWGNNEKMKLELEMV